MDCLKCSLVAEKVNTWTVKIWSKSRVFCGSNLINIHISVRFILYLFGYRNCCREPHIINPYGIVVTVSYCKGCGQKHIYRYKQTCQWEIAMALMNGTSYFFSITEPRPGVKFLLWHQREAWIQGRGFKSQREALELHLSQFLMSFWHSNLPYFNEQSICWQRV